MIARTIEIAPTQLGRIDEKSAITYINEIPKKYAPGAKIAKVPTNGALAGKTLEGKMILEVPIQAQPVPKGVLDAAAKSKVTIRDVMGKIYNP